MKPISWLAITVLWILVNGCRTSPSFDFGAYSEAEHLYKKGKYEKAIAKYQEHLRENPEGNLAVISMYYMAKCYDELGQTNEARQLYRNIVKENPKLVWANFSKARLEELGRKNTS